VNSGRGAFRRRVVATRRIWRPGSEHLIFSEALEPPPKRLRLPAGYLDLPVADGMLPREPVLFRGWALFPSGPPTKVELWLGDTYLGRARLGDLRPDVQRATRMDLGMIAGFEHVLDLSSWKGGNGYHRVRALATGPRGERLELGPVITCVAEPAATALPNERALVREPLQPMVAQAVPQPPPRVAGRHGSHPRLLAFTHQLDLGGAQLYLLDLLRGLREDGFECTVVSPLDGVLRERLEELGIRVHISIPIPIDSPAAYESRVEELTSWAARGHHDVAFLNTIVAFPGADVAARLGIPAVWAIHESYDPSMIWWMYGTGLHRDVRARAEASLARAAAGIFEADATRSQYEPYLPPGRCVTLPYGLDLMGLAEARSSFDRAAARRERGVPADAKVVLCMGTIEPRKAQIPLVQAFGMVANRHPDARLVLIGGRDDDYTRALEQYVKSCAPEGRVELLPVLPDVWPWYGLADIVVCASDVESLPRSVLEAMAWETPVVATAVFGLPELIEHGVSGWLCEPRDVGAMAEALDRALGAGQDELRRIGSAARELVERRHAAAPYVEACAQLLRDVASGAGHWREGRERTQSA
jgi:glycosyltransferase involved in cell wall biosynthesis